MKKLVVIILAVFMMSPTAFAMQVADVTLPDSLMAGGDTLLLNGAGLRKKFIIKVYAGGLYLKQKDTDPVKIIDEDAPMAIRMHFIHDGVSSEKLVDGWNKGFMNGTTEILHPFKQRSISSTLFSRKKQRRTISTISSTSRSRVSVFTSRGNSKVLLRDSNSKRLFFQYGLVKNRRMQS